MAISKANRQYSVWAGVGAGAGAALAMMVVMGALRLGLNFPTIPELMLNTIVQALGGQAFSDALDKFYYSGRPLLFAFILEGTLLVGVVLGVLYAWATRWVPARWRSALGGPLYGLVIGVLLNAFFLPIVGQPAFGSDPRGIYSASPVPLWLGMMVLALVFGTTLQWLLPARRAATTLDGVAATGSAPPPAEVTYGDRRHFLRMAGGALLALLGGLGYWGAGTVINQGGLSSPVQRNATSGGSAQSNPTSQSSSSQSPTTTTASSSQAQGSPSAVAGQTGATPGGQPPAPTPTAPEVSVSNLPLKDITPDDLFYHVSKNFFDPSPSSHGWKLQIHGLVDKPYSLDYDQLTALPAIEAVVGMMCISNPIGGGLIGNTRWKGVHMADLLKKAGPSSRATKVVMRAVDDYSDSITLAKALDPDVMVVWEMDGKTLASGHGFPARVLVPGIYGMKHVKWLTDIELVDYDFKGFWQQPSQGWNDPAPVNTMSRIDFPMSAQLDLKPQLISGVAFAGDRGISKVELTMDGGKTWNKAVLKPRLSPTSWVLWGYEWTPQQPGDYRVMVRATDGKGNVQTDVKADPYPNGATGYHTVRFLVGGGSGLAPANGPRIAARPVAIPLSSRDPSRPNSQ